MPNSQFMYFAPADINLCIANVHAAVKASSIAYQNVKDPVLISDIRAVGRMYTESFLTCIMEERAPFRSELESFEKGARDRAQHNFPLEALLNSYRVCSRTLWDFVSERATADQLGRFAMLTLEYNDMVSGAAISAFILERERQRRSHYDASRLLLIQTILGSEAHTDELEAAALDVGVGGAPWTAIKVAVAEYPQSSSRSLSELAMSRVHDSMHQRFGWALTATVPRGLLFVLPQQHLEWGNRTVLHVAQSLVASVRIGHSLPCSSLSELSGAYRQAERALEIGALVAPNGYVHSYENLMMFDLFQRGDLVTHFVEATLGPLLRLAPAKRQRFRKTLAAYLECGHSRKQTALKLGIHHNTLTSRLESIDEILSCDLRSGRESFRLQLALHLASMVGFSEFDSGGRS